MRGKAIPNQNFLCAKCFPDYRGRKVDVNPVPRGASGSGGIVWAIFKGEMADPDSDMLKMTLNREPGYGGFNRDVEQVSRLADRLMDGRLMFKFHIGRVWMPEGTTLKPVRILISQTYNIEME